MNLAMRKYQTEDDFWRIRDFLRQVFLLNDRQELSWHVARFDYWRWHGIENLGDGRLEQDVFIWESPGGEMAAVLTREGPGDAFLQVHPVFCTPELEEEMIAVAEEHLAVPKENKREIHVWVNSIDSMSQQILVHRGYQKGSWPEHQRRFRFERQIPDTPIPAGYRVRALGDVEELPARSWASFRSFHPNDPRENYQGWEWYQNIQRIPLYRRDLDIVATTPDGEIASFCTIWYDDVTRSAYYEPVGTVPEHQRRGLGKAVIWAGLRRLQRLGALVAFVGGYSPEANGLYESAGFSRYLLLEPWSRVF